MKRALITGVAGFTGAYLPDELRGIGYIVTGTWHAPKPGASRLDVSLQADMLDGADCGEEIATPGPGAVILLAAVSHVTRDTGEALYQINIMATRTLLMALCAIGYQIVAVVLTSTGKFYGGTQGVLDKTVAPAPQKDYPVCQPAMECMAILWRNGLTITIVRPFSYTGTGQTELFLIPRLVLHISERRAVVEVGNTDISRDFSDARDMVAACARPASIRHGWGPYTICAGRVYALKEILAMLREATGHGPEIRGHWAFVRSDDVLCLRDPQHRPEAQVDSLKSGPLEGKHGWRLEGTSTKADRCSH